MPLLSWLTRGTDLLAARRAPYRLLEPVPDMAYGDPSSENLLIQGDNLEAVKSLLPYYAGRVKCIYIDPPYNTKSAFEHYDDNLEHAQWLAMIYPRLELLRELLAEDGSIWVSIDDNEGHYLKVVMDEIFGRKNFLTSFIWKKSYGGGAKSKWVVGLHEFVLCYAKTLESFPEMFLPPDPDVEKKYYKFKDDKLGSRGPYRLQPLATTSMDDRPNLRYPIVMPDGRETWPEKQWQWSRDRVELAMAQDELVITEKRGKFTVSYKQYLLDPSGEERKRKPVSVIEGHYTQHGSYESMALFGLQNKFAFPKPEGLVRTILESCTNSGDLVLDSFLGSGTTAAVAHKMGRRWIGIEMGDHAVTHCLPRLRKVVDGEAGGISESVGWKGGGGFRFSRLGEPVFDAEGRINPAIAFSTLAAHVWFSETGTPLSGVPESPFLGAHEGIGYYLMRNPVPGDPGTGGGGVLTSRALSAFPTFDGPKVIYGDLCCLGGERLREANVTFKQIPYDIKAR
jgi:adenine-specific DNA-methyltransferase